MAINTQIFKWELFIAHSSADKESAEALYEFLEPHAQVFLDSRCLWLGDDWDQKIGEAQKSARATVVLISSNTENAYYQREEIAAAIALARQNEQTHRVVPVYLDREAFLSNSVPYGLRLKHGLTVSDELELEDVADSLLALLKRLRSDPGLPGIASSPNHRPQGVTGAKSGDDIGITISVISEEGASHSDTTLSYELRRSAAGISIEPSMVYLTTLGNGGPIKPLSYTWVPFCWDFPSLDFKVVNNSKRTVFLTEAVFDIDESHLDPRPVLIIRPDNYRSNALHFRVLNEGWEKVEHFRVKFHLIPLSKNMGDPLFSEPYAHELAVEDFSESVNICIAEAFREAGVDLERLASLSAEHSDEGIQSCLGTFQRGGALVSGELLFHAPGLDGSVEQRSVRFSTVVWLFNQYSVGVPAPPSYAYATKFEVNRRDYERRVSISHVLKSQEADRFTIKIGMDKSSFHKFRAKLIYNGSREIESSPVQLLGFVPRSGAAYVEAKN